MKSIFALVLAPLLFGCAMQVIAPRGYATESPKRKDKLVLSDEEWKKRLTDEQYKILRAKGTEPAFCGINLNSDHTGTYSCVGCSLELFKTPKKFDSGTGWPSFLEPISKERVWFKSDKELGMVRTEVLCARCDGHLGHVFDDGPEPTGLRFCMNGTVLKFKADK